MRKGLRSQRVPVDPRVIGGALEEFLASEGTRRLVQRVLSGAKIYVQGFTHRAELDEDAQAALEGLEKLAGELPTAIVWSVDEWLRSECYYDASSGFYVMDGLPISYKRASELLEKYPEVQHEDGWVEVIPGLHERLDYLAWQNEVHRGELQEED